MADYELGTAHGRIVVDYDDKGIGQAEKSLDKLKAKSRELLGQFTTLAKSWVAQARDMGRAADDFTNKAENVAKTVAAISVAAAAINGPVRNLVPGIKVLKDLREAFGGLPDGAERFPKLIQNIIRVSAAVSLFHGATGLLARATRNIAGVSFLTRGLAGFGNVLNNLAAPLRFVSSGVLGFLTVLKGLEIVKKYAKYFELFHVGTTGLAAGMNIVLPLAAKLTTDIKNLLGAVALAPAALGIFALALGTIKVATAGFGDALKAIAKGDAKAFNEAIKDMAPAAQETARAFRDLYEKAWKPLQKAVQQKLFDGLAPVLRELAGNLLPSIERGMLRVATSFNVAAKEFAGFLNDAEVKQDFGEGIDYSAKAVDNLSKAISPLLEALYLVWRVGTEVFADITKGAGDAARRFRDFVGAARASGQLEAWMRRGVKAIGDLIKSVINFGKIFRTIFQGLGISGGDGFLAWLSKATAAFNDFLNSAKGQEILQAIGQWMRDGAEHAKALADVFLNDVLPAIQAFLPFIKAMGDAVNAGLVAALKVLAPIFKVLGEILSALAPALAPIVTAIVFMGTVLLGLGLAFKIAAGAVAIFRTAFLALKGIQGIVGLLGLLPGVVGGIFLALAPLLRLLRGGLIAAGLFEIARGIDEMNLKAAGGDPEKLDDMGQSLHDLVSIWDGLWNTITTGDFTWLTDQFKDIGDEFDQLSDKFNKGESPVGAWFQKVKKSFETDFLGFFSNLGTQIGSALDGAGAAIGAWFSKVGESFDRDFLGFFRDLPGKIGGFFASIPGAISSVASTLWQGFLSTIQANFGPVISFFSQSPYEMGFAIGSGIGALLKAGGDLIANLLLGAQQKYVEFTVWLSTLLPAIGAWFASLGESIRQWAVDAWQKFVDGTTQKGEEGVEQARQIPSKIGEALSNLANTVGQKAVEAWEAFKTWTTTKIEEARAFIATFPAKAAAALAALRGFLEQKAREAMQGFQTWITNKTNEVLGFIRSIPGRIVSALGNLGSLLVNAGRSVIDGLLAGIRAGVQAMYDFVSGIAAGIAARKGPLPKDRILLIPAGVAIVQGLVKGMKQTMPELYKQVNAVNSTLGGVGGLAGSVNLSPTGAMSNVRTMAQAPTIPTGIARGGDGASSGDVFNMGDVVIPAKDIQQFKDVTEFFGAVKQTARAGRATR